MLRTNQSNMVQLYSCRDRLHEGHRPINRARDTDKIEQSKLIGRETVGALFVSNNRKKRQ